MAMIFPIISAIGSIAGGFAQAGQQQAAAQAQANAAYYNAAVAQNNANAALQAAQANKATQDRKNRSSLERVRSKYLGSGIELEGTPLLVLMEETSQMALESDRILHEGRVQQTNFMNQANLDRFKGDSALAAGEAKSSGTLLGGIFSGVSGVGRAFFSGA